MVASPRLAARELLGVALLGIVLALAMHWPLPLHMGRDIAQDLGDPLVQAWQVAWDGHALRAQPTELLQANTFWPLPNSLAISDALVGYVRRPGLRTSRTSSGYAERVKVMRPSCQPRRRSVAVLARSRLPAPSRARTAIRYAPAGNEPSSCRRQRSVPFARR